MSDIVYYNITQPGASGKRTNTAYIKNNTEPIIRKQKDYKLAVARMSIPTNILPIFIAETTGSIQNKDNELVYSVTLEFDTVEVTKNLQMISVSPTASGEFIEEYYFVYTYSQFFEMINVAFQSAFTDLGLLAPIPGGSLAPQFEFDAPSQKFVLYITTHYESTLPTPIRIYFNDRLFQPYLLSLPVTYYLNSNPKRAEIRIIQNLVNTVNIGGTDYITVYSNYNILNKWNDVRSIQLTTTMPINFEFIEVNYGSKYGGLTQRTSKELMLKDFQIQYPEYDSVARTTIDYAVSEFEYIDLFGDDDLRNISVNVYWVDKDGKRRPLYITGRNVLHIKLMFKRKELIEF